MTKKLLLADDSLTIQKVIGITFANEDYDLTIVDNGDAAFEKAQADKPNLVLADVFMPGKNGYELCAAIKQDPNLQDVPVLLLTGTFEPFDEEKAISSGAEGWIAKPFESQSLIEKVESLLAGAPAGAAPAAPAPEPAAPVQPAAPAPEPAAPAIEPAAPTSPDSWDDVTFDEPEIEPEPVAEAPVFEDEADFIVDDGSAAEASDSAAVWGDTSETIELDEPEIVAVEPSAPEPPVEPAAPVPPAVPEPPPQAAAPTPPVTPEPVQPVVPEPVQPVAEPAPQPTPPVQPTAAPADVESQVAGMSDADLEKIVERVAGVVLEKIAWEVVPDLAESLIRDEIRKIKENL